MEKSTYENLNIKVSWSWRVKNRLLSFLRKIFYYIPFLGRCFSFLGRQAFFFGKLGEEEKTRLKYIYLLENEKEDPQKLGSEYGYDDEIHELIITNRYHNQLKHGDFKNLHSESSTLYEHAINKISNLLMDDKNIKDFHDFGVSYAYIDSELAGLHQSVNFSGIDRSKFTKLYNEECFSSFRNMEFIAGDVFELLGKRRFDGGIFFHMRTMCLLPKYFISKLYRAVAAAGFKYIIGMEQVGISRQTFKAYEFSDDTKPSVHFRHFMFLHNYPELLKSSGFAVRNIELVKTKHPHEDYRILSYIGQRN